MLASDMKVKDTLTIVDGMSFKYPGASVSPGIGAEAKLRKSKHPKDKELSASKEKDRADVKIGDILHTDTLISGTEAIEGENLVNFMWTILLPM